MCSWLNIKLLKENLIYLWFVCNVRSVLLVLEEPTTQMHENARLALVLESRNCRKLPNQWLMRQNNTEMFTGDIYASPWESFLALSLIPVIKHSLCMCFKRFTCRQAVCGIRSAMDHMVGITVYAAVSLKGPCRTQGVQPWVNFTPPTKTILNITK